MPVDPPLLVRTKAPLKETLSLFLSLSAARLPSAQSFVELMAVSPQTDFFTRWEFYFPPTLSHFDKKAFFFSIEL